MHTLSAEELRLIYPESDGKPMAENTLQFEWIALIKLNLEACFVQQPDVFIAADLFWYPVEGDGTIRVAPDVMVALGRPKGHRGSYIQFLENNVPPQVVFEILSPGNRRAEMARKLKFYSTHGAEEYYVYDPDHNKLEIYLRHNGALQSVIYQDYWISPLLKIKFEWTTETLHLSKPNGEPFLSYLELVEFHDQAVEALSESRQLLKMEQQRFQELSNQNVAIQQRYEQARKQALVEQERAKQQRFIAEQEGLRAEQESLRAEQESLRAEQESLRAGQETQRAEQETKRAEQESQRAEQESQRAEQEALKAAKETQRVKASIKAFQQMGISDAEIAAILGLADSEFAAYLL